MDTVVTVKDVKHRLSELLERAAQGDRVIIRQRGKPSLALTRLDTAEEELTLQTRETRQQRIQRAAAQLGKHLRLSPQQQRRLEELGQKNKRSMLTEEERTELLQLLHTLEEISRQRAQALDELR